MSDAEGQARISGAMTADSLQHTEKLLKKETQGEFEIEGLLGRGGMAMVYLATEVHLSRKVAIKVLHLTPFHTKKKKSIFKTFQESFFYDNRRTEENNSTITQEP